MGPILSSDAIEVLGQKCQYRLTQLQQLALYYNQYLPCPSTLVVHGLENTGKLETTLALLRATGVDHALIKSQECLSQRHLLTKIFAACIRALGKEQEIERYDRIDSLNALSVNLQKLLHGRSDELVLVIEEINRQKGASQTLLPALARLSDLVAGLSILFITTSLRPLRLHRPGVPYVHFPPYTRSEALEIVLATPPPLQPESLPDEFPSIGTASLEKIYAAFVSAVYDTLIIHTSSTSLSKFQRTCERLWPRFIWPMLSNEPLPSRNGITSTVTWDFPRLLIKGRPLFQLQGEESLQEKLSLDSDGHWTFDQLLEEHQQKKRDSTGVSAPVQNTTTSLRSSEATRIAGSTKPHTHSTPVLKFFPTLILLSSYLASHTPPKHDIILFSRLSSSSSHKRRYLSSALNKNRTPKTSRVRKTPTKSKASASANDTENNDDPGTPSKKRNSTVSNAEATRAPAEKEKTHKSSRLQFEKTSSIPRPFTLERVVAIIRAIHPDGLPRTKGAADTIYSEMVELERLRLVVRLGTGANAGMGSSSSSALGLDGGGGVSSIGGGGGGGSGAGAGAGAGGNTNGSKGTDDGILEEKWRVNVGREVVVEISRRWGMSLEGWEID